NTNGAFVIRNIASGRYQFEPRFFARYWYVQSITLGTTTPKPATIDAAASWTTLKLGEQISNLTITLAEGAASIRGKLTSAETPADAVVYLVPSESDKAENVLRFFVTAIGADGTFALNNVPPGRYWVLVQTTVDPQIATMMKLRLPETTAARMCFGGAAQFG